MNRTHRAALTIAGAAIELLIALAWWWRPEHALLWAGAAAFVLLIAAIVERGDAVARAPARPPCQARPP